MKSKVNVFALVLVMFLVSCPSIPKTPEGRFDEARARWNSTMREYRTQYALQDAVTQEKWDNIFARPLYEAGLALGAWEDALGDATKERTFTDLKDQVLRLLVHYKVIEVGG